MKENRDFDCRFYHECLEIASKLDIDFSCDGCTKERPKLRALSKFNNLQEIWKFVAKVSGFRAEHYLWKMIEELGYQKLQHRFVKKVIEERFGISKKHVFEKFKKWQARQESFKKYRSKHESNQNSDANIRSIT